MPYDDHEPGLDPEPISFSEQQELDLLRDELNRRPRFPARYVPAYRSRDTAAGRWNGISLGDN